MRFCLECWCKSLCFDVVMVGLVVDVVVSSVWCLFSGVLIALNIDFIAV